MKMRTNRSRIWMAMTASLPLHVVGEIKVESRNREICWPKKEIPVLGVL